MIEIQWFAADEQEAKKICQSLVKRRLVACANLVHNVTSIHIWHEQLEESEEVLCILKAPDDNFGEIKDFIEEHCSYDVPAILKLDVQVNKAYNQIVAQI